MSNHVPAVPHLDLVEGRPVTTSINIAQVFGKRHDRVLRAIDQLDIPDDFRRPNFGEASYMDAQGKPRPMYHLTRDGFTLLAMGFTGKAAMTWKLRYIEAFNAMEEALTKRAMAGADLTGTLIETTSRMFQALAEAVDKLTTRLERLESGAGQFALIGDAMAIPKDRYIELLEAENTAIKSTKRKNNKPRPLTENDRAEIVRLRAGGLGIAEISRRVGRSKATVHYLISLLGREVRA